MAIDTTSNGLTTESVLRDCVAALQAVASYRLPEAMDRRLLWLSESKESLSGAEEEELRALVDFAEERTVEKVQAHAVLKRLIEVWPKLLVPQP